MTTTAVSQAATSKKPSAPAGEVKPNPPSHESVVPTVTISNLSLVRWMFTFLAPVKPMVFLACLWLTVTIGADIVATNEIGTAINSVQKLVVGSTVGTGLWTWLIHDPAARTLRLSLGIVTGLVILQAIIRYLREVSNMQLSMNMVYYLREAIYDKLQRVGFAFHDVLSTGQLINRALSDLQNVRSFIQTAVLVSLDIVLYVAGYMTLILTKSPWLALLSLVPLPLWTWYILRFGRKVQPASKAVMEAGDKNISIITESIAGVHVIKAFATEQQEINKYNANCDQFFDRVYYRIRLFASFTPVIRIIGMFSHLSLFLVVGLMILSNKMQAGAIIILGTAMGTILGKLQQVASINDQYQNAIVSARRLYQVLMAPPSVAERPDAKPLPDGTGHIRFEDVSFGYDPTKPVLHHISFEAKGGAVIAIVGPTGTGKSTLVNLIARFYDPQQGRIFVDGVDVRDTQLASLRTQIGFVFQETYLFSDTVEANIAYGRPGIRGGEVEAAARLSQAHEFIEQMPRGYQTMLGERGSSLSGGQRQRLAIARAILTNPRVLVLDDATAAVDPETEDLIRRAMQFVMHGRTTFIIAHRISSVKRADLVIVLEEGRITQMGTHEQLMDQEGHYREIAAAQLRGDLETKVSLDRESRKDEEKPSHMDRMTDTQRMAAIAHRSETAKAGQPTERKVQQEETI